MDLLKRLTEVITFLAPYPTWVKIMFSAWLGFSVLLGIALILAPRSRVSDVQFTGTVRNARSHEPVSPVSVLLEVDGTALRYVTDSNGVFRFTLPAGVSQKNATFTMEAAGYQARSENVLLKPDSPDLSFSLETLAPGIGPTEGGAADDLFAKLARRKAELLAPPADAVARYSKFISRDPNSGVLKLLAPEVAYDNRKILGWNDNRAYYEFLTRSNDYGYGSDISIEQGRFKVGFAGADYGYFLTLGDISFEKLDTASADAPDWLPSSARQAWSYLWTYKPPTRMSEIRKDQKEAYAKVIGDATLSDRAPAAVGTAFLLRSIQFQRSDILVGLRVDSRLPDGSLVIAWKVLKVFPQPVIGVKDVD